MNLAYFQKKRLVIFTAIRFRYAVRHINMDDDPCLSDYSISETLMRDLFANLVQFCYTHTAVLETRPIFSDQDQDQDRCIRTSIRIKLSK